MLEYTVICTPRRRTSQLAIAELGSSHITTVILLGTVLAVYVGRDGTPFAVSMVFAGYFFAKTVFSPFWGAVADVSGTRRAVLLFAASLMVASVVPLLLVDGVWEMVTIRIVYGVFAAAYLPIMLTIVSQHGGAESRGR